ncbi:Transcription factor bHLH36 like [Actinidia chinensis var. chinensis]|uniref:Transcription factor bHLH36 like n=1 Tax=Actinidia chinensis var. chinensis TaxID=1590841 RepID=A0A2R6QLD3_ACTCC|nr:Transcription factor bHLH36 like [Actinidia chinensis var. chinensis]
MEHNHSSSSTRTRIDRKTIEKNRRNHMKALFSKLHSLVPHHHTSREAMSLADHIDEAANYIKNLEKHLEKLRQKRDRLVAIAKQNIASMSCAENVGLRPPQIEVHEMGSALTVVLVTGLNYKFMFNETIRVLHEEGAEIVNAGFSVVDDTVFHTIHSKVGESGLGSGAARVSERLKKFAYDAS